VTYEGRSSVESQGHDIGFLQVGFNRVRVRAKVAEGPRTVLALTKASYTSSLRPHTLVAEGLMH
jgi:hypothetical protein